MTERYTVVRRAVGEAFPFAVLDNRKVIHVKVCKTEAEARSCADLRNKGK